MVVALIGIFAIGAVPSLRALGQRFHAYSVRTSLQQAIEDTRMLALVRRQILILCGSEDTRLCATHWEKGWLIKTATGTVIDTRSFSGGRYALHYRLFPAGRSALVFLPSGWPEIENGTFWYCLDRTTAPVWAFVLDRSGRQRQLLSGPDGSIHDSQAHVLSC